MHKHFLPVTALALAMGCRCAQALAAENTGQRLAGFHEVADDELAELRGRYIVGDNAVLWFGVEMVSTWQTDRGQTLQGTLTLGMDFSKNPNQPTVDFVPTVTITTAHHALPASAATISRNVQSAGLANVSGMLQSVQIAGDNNVATNVTRLSIQNQGNAAAAMTTAATNGASDLYASAGDASASSSYSKDGARLTLAVAGQGTASQWIRPGGLGQTIALTADNQSVTNQMVVSMVTQSSYINTTLLAHALGQSLGMNRGNR